MPSRVLSPGPRARRGLGGQQPRGQALGLAAGLLVLASPVQLQAAGPSPHTPATALTAVYRCTPSANPSGVVLYTDEPCPGGLGLQALDTRSPSQVQQARARVREQDQWAQQQAQQRRHEEQRQAQQAQRQPIVMGREQVNISRHTRSDALREAELRRMGRPHRQGPPALAAEPRPAAGGSVPKVKPDRP